MLKSRKRVNSNKQKERRREVKPIVQIKQIALVVLILLGFYFIFIHRPPLPLNHEDIGLGTNHLAHSLLGIILLVGAGYLYWKSNKK